MSSDPIERRFGWWRQLNGANYFASVSQFLTSEKSIRTRSLISKGYTVSDIKKIMGGSDDEVVNIEPLYDVLSDITLDDLSQVIFCFFNSPFSCKT